MNKITMEANKENIAVTDSMKTLIINCDEIILKQGVIEIKFKKPDEIASPEKLIINGVEFERKGRQVNGKNNL